MSNRSLIELNHDCSPSDEVEAGAFGVAIARYMRTGSASCLPEGVTQIDMRHHSDVIALAWADYKPAEMEVAAKEIAVAISGAPFPSKASLKKAHAVLELLTGKGMLK